MDWGCSFPIGVDNSLWEALQFGCGRLEGVHPRNSDLSASERWLVSGVLGGIQRDS